MAVDKPTEFSQQRRQLLKTLSSTLLLGVLPCSLLSACQQPHALLRVASNVFPGYEFLHLAAHLNYYPTEQIRMIAMPSATSIMQALAAGSIEAAALTLDEVISARADNMNLKIVTVLDISVGADVILAQPSIDNLSMLKGKRIGTEQSAVGAVILAAALQSAGLNTDDVDIHYATVDQHYQMFTEGKVDALVTFDPIPRQLAREQYRQLFDSSQIAGTIVDVIVIREEVATANPAAVRQLVAGHFQAQNYFRQQPQAAAEIMAQRLKIPASEVIKTFDGLALPDASENQQWLNKDNSKLQNSIDKLQQLMQQAGLLKQAVSTQNIFDSQFLPVQS